MWLAVITICATIIFALKTVSEKRLESIEQGLKQVDKDLNDKFNQLVSIIGALRTDLHKEITSAKEENAKETKNVGERVAQMEGEMGSIRSMLSSLVGSLIGSKMNRRPKTPTFGTLFAPEDDGADFSK